jgi:glycosyltransferase involved in cell wall biosynthesis
VITLGDIITISNLDDIYFMLNVVFLSPHSDPEAKLGEVDSGGQCVYEYELAKALSLIPETRVTIYCRKKFEYPDLTEVSDTFTIKRIVCGGKKFIPKERLGPYLDEFSYKVAEDLITMDISVVHGHYWDGGKAALLLAKYYPRNFPIIWTPHSLGSEKRRSFTGIKNEMKYYFASRIAWETFTMLQADMLIVSSQNEKDKVVFDYGIYRKKIQVIPPGIETSNFENIDKKDSRRILGLPEDKIILMALGRLDRRKGYHNAIRIFAELKKRIRIDNAMLVIFAGGQGKRTAEESLYSKELHSLAKKLGVAEDVIFRPSIEHGQVKLVYGAADVHLCMSNYEPFGITVLEAMYVGVPVIATDNGGPKNVIVNNYSGILVAPTNYLRAAYYISSLIKDKDFNTKIVTHARYFAEKYYNWQARAGEFHKAYQKVVRSNYKSKKQDFLKHIRLL